ncbi:MULTISPECIES: hypothetical protein [unclassified Pseudarthrobacter]|uniref:hypothetical protein n=1 Tax=unclassified Pseudarthrobacter TaxID=2647000 RepID=UPI003630D5CF
MRTEERLTVLRRMADELAGGVETLTPRVQEQLKRVGQKAGDVAAPASVEVTHRAARRWWWAGGFLMAAAATAVVWRSVQASKQEPVPSVAVPETDSKANEDDPDLAHIDSPCPEASAIFLYKLGVAESQRRGR